MAELAIQPGDPISVAPVAPYALTAGETAWCDRFNRLVARLGPPDPAGGEEHSDVRTEREGFRIKLRQQADAICAAPTAARAALVEKAVKDNYWNEGIYTDRVARLGKLPFDVQPVRDPNTGLTVDIRILTKDAVIPADKQKFKVRLDQAVTIVRTVFADNEPDAAAVANDAGWWARNWARLREAATSPLAGGETRRSEYLIALAGIARVGLMGQDTTQTPFADLALTGFANEFVAREAGRVKNRYLRKLGLCALLALIAATAAYVLVSLLSPVTWIFFRFRNFFVLAGAAAVGTWLSFSIRRQVLTFEDLATLEDDRLNPGVRILFMVALTTVVGLIFWTGMVSLKIGDFRTDFRLTGSFAALIGALCGIAERSLAGAVGRRATELVTGIAGAGKPTP